MGQLRPVERRAHFNSQFGLIAAASGAMVGLGNIWRFPSETASNGGALFILIYIVCVAFIGIPLAIAEFMIGRAANSNAYSAFTHFVPKKEGWQWLGALGIFATLLLMGYYVVVAGWTLQYIYASVSGDLSRYANIAKEFDALVGNPERQVALVILFLFLSAIVIHSGVRRGIERASKILIPILFVLLITLVVGSLTLKGASQGLAFLLHPDFSQLRPYSFLDALGQVFFSLSLGGGVLITYGSYFRKDTHLVRATAVVVCFDTFVALLAGFMIFPALFALTQGDESVVTEALHTGGVGLVFKVLPALCLQLPWSTFWTTSFFVLLVIAALTTTMSYLETVTVFLEEKVRLSRQWASVVATILIFLLAILCSYSEQAFDFFDFISTKVLLPLVGLGVSIFVGWRLKKAVLYEQLVHCGSQKYSSRFLHTYSFILQYVAPVAILFILVYGLVLE